MHTVETYRDRDNNFWVVFKLNGTILTPAEMAIITKIEIKHLGVYYNTTTHPTGFTRDDANGKVKIKPYELDLPVSSDIVEVLVYDAVDNIHGKLWNAFEWKIRSDVLLPTTLAPTTVP